MKYTRRKQHKRIKRRRSSKHTYTKKRTARRSKYGGLSATLHQSSSSKPRPSSKLDYSSQLDDVLFNKDLLKGILTPFMFLKKETFNKDYITRVVNKVTTYVVDELDAMLEEYPPRMTDKSQTKIHELKDNINNPYSAVGDDDAMMTKLTNNKTLQEISTYIKTDSLQKGGGRPSAATREARRAAAATRSSSNTTQLATRNTRQNNSNSRGNMLDKIEYIACLFIFVWLLIVKFFILRTGPTQDHSDFFESESFDNIVNRIPLPIFITETLVGISAVIFSEATETMRELISSLINILFYPFFGNDTNEHRLSSLTLRSGAYYGMYMKILPAFLFRIPLFLLSYIFIPLCAYMDPRVDRRAMLGLIARVENVNQYCVLALSVMLQVTQYRLEHTIGPGQRAAAIHDQLVEGVSANRSVFNRLYTTHGQVVYRLVLVVGQKLSLYLTGQQGNRRLTNGSP